MPIIKPYDPSMFPAGFKNLGTPTKGSLIVGNGSSWEKLPVGADGTLLTADAAENTGTKWAIGGGSGGIYTIVSTEVDLIAALAATDPLIYIDSNITATQDYVIEEDTEIRIGTNVTLNMGGSFALFVDPGIDFSLTGDSKNNSIISWNMSGSSRDLINMSGGMMLNVNNITVTESAVALGSGYFSTNSVIMNCFNCVFIFADSGSGVLMTQTFSSGNFSTLSDVEFVGGGASCYGKVSFLNVTSYVYFNNIKISGVWLAAPGFVSINSIIRGCIDGLFVADGITGRVSIEVSEVNNVQALNTPFYFSNVALASNIKCAALTLNTVQSLTNFLCSSMSLDSGNASVVNGQITSAFTESSIDNVSFNNVVFVGGANISITNDFSFMNCSFGDYSTPGSGTTLTIQASSERTIAVGCKSDSAIVNTSGTSEVSLNTVF